MPTISRFFGIVIAMYFDDHAPPHFHAFYGEHSAAITTTVNPIVLIRKSDTGVYCSREVQRNDSSCLMHEPEGTGDSHTR